jgi:hypothetical protein
LPDHRNITDIRTERVRSAIRIRFAILLCIIKNGKRIDCGYPGEITKSRNFSGWQKKDAKSENDR